MSILDDVRFWATVIEEQRRILICPPAMVDAVNRKLVELGMGGFHEIQASPYMPDNQIWMVDPNAMEAATRQAMQRVRF
ncbi:hypothetical protein [Micromonospora sp. NPDC005174]|uniref:hypothetical protein n=1 Tax=Micromonospora sp. NPDC005174 TaxID=3157018 RepID=UPI0033B1F1A0